MIILCHSHGNRFASFTCLARRAVLLPMLLTQNGMLGCCFFSFIMQYHWSPTKTSVSWRWRGAGKESKEASMLLVSRESDQSFL